MESLESPSAVGGRLGAGLTVVVPSQHVCQFYEDDDSLCEAAARYAADGILAEQPILLIATDEHRVSIASRMDGFGVAFADAQRSGRLEYHDAESMLASFMVGDLPDAARFEEVMSHLLGRLTLQLAPQPVRIFGELVDLLWRAGNPEGALALERLWSDLAGRKLIELLCGYSMASFHADTPFHDRFEEVCAAHGRNVPAASPGSGEHLERLGREVGRLQEALLAARDETARATRVKQDFLALMSHELRTPLNAILGYQDLLEYGVGGPLGAEQRAYLARMRSCSLQLLRLIERLLSLSRAEPGGIELSREVCDAAALARETAALMESAAHRRGLTLDVTGPYGDVSLLTDTGTVRQILLNLLTNAVKFTDAGGIRLNVVQRDDEVSFEVTDTGVGVRREDQERIFEPFVQLESPAHRRHGGSGLGLAVGRDLARHLGGDLSVRSEPGVGSTFTLTLPIAELAAA